MSVLEQVVGWVAVFAFFWAATLAPIVGIGLTPATQIACFVSMPILSFYFKMKQC
jgi:hypothetical protein